MRKAIIIAIISILTLTGCQKEVKKYQNGKLVFDGVLDSNGLPEKGKVYDPHTGKETFDVYCCCIGRSWLLILSVL